MLLPFRRSNRNLAANDGLKEPKTFDRRYRCLETLASSSPDEIYRVSPDWTHLEALQRQQFSSGSGGQQWQNIEFKKYIDPRDLEMALSAIWEGVQTKSVFHFECRVLRWNDSSGWASLRASPVFVENDEVAEWIVTATDIDVKKQMETAILRGEQLASLGRMTASISHEINNPLEAITNLLFLARLDLRLTSETREILDQADIELRKVATITRQFLSFYRESRSPAPTSLEDTIESAFDLLKAKAGLKQVRIERKYFTDLKITAVPEELRQVFTNLIANSLDAIDVGGKIAVRISRGSVKCKGKWFRPIHVADNGSGISPFDKMRIFDPFFTTKGTAGTGLGLWITKQIVEKYGGTIQVRSRSASGQNGTIFSVLVPTGEPSA